ncbi:MAG: signal peptidase I [Eubacteriales bacterium]|jgi:signal peptidase
MANVRKKRKPRILSILFNLILVLLVVMAAIFVVDRMNNRVTFVFDHAVIIIATGSMEPAIPAHSCILITRARPEDIKVGDIITFYSDDPAIAGSLNTHRVQSVISSIEGIEFQTKGDNNLLPDAYNVRGERLVGKYVRNLPILSYVARLILSPYGYVVVILFLLIYMAAVLIPSARRKKADARAAEIERRVAEEVARLRENEKKQKSGRGSRDSDK